MVSSSLPCPLSSLTKGEVIPGEIGFGGAQVPSSSKTSEGLSILWWALKRHSRAHSLQMEYFKKREKGGLSNPTISIQPGHQGIKLGVHAQTWLTRVCPFPSGSHETRRFSQLLPWETRWRAVGRCLCVMSLCQIVPDTPANKNAASATPDIMLLFPLMVQSLQWCTIKDANSASKANPIFWGEGAQVRTPFCSPLWWVSYVLSFCPK